MGFYLLKGHSFETAIELQPGIPFSDYIGAFGEQRFYHFTTSNGKLDAETTGNADVYGTLYQSNRQKLISNDNGGTGNNFKISYNKATITIPAATIPTAPAPPMEPQWPGFSLPET